LLHKDSENRAQFTGQVRAEPNLFELCRT